MNDHTNRIQTQGRDTPTESPEKTVSPGKRLFFMITSSGFAAAVAQIVLLRELMAICYGIELCMGVILAAWLLGSALGCRVFMRPRARSAQTAILPGALMILAAVVLPLTLLTIRAAGIFTGTVPGELSPLTRLLPVCIGVPLPLSFLSGALFALCWNAIGKRDGIPISIYVGEALGAAAGGGLFYLLVACQQSAMTVLLVTALGLLLTAAVFFRRRHRGRRPPLVLACLLTGIAVACLFFRADIDLASRRLQWGPDFITSRDTPYQNLAMLRNGGQVSVFSNGLWLFSAPDPMSREWAVHPALLMHPAPGSVLLLGGDPAGLATEILRHPSVTEIHVVELDPAMTAFATSGTGESSAPETTSGNRVIRHYGDAANFIRNASGTWDVIVMNVGDPVNAQMNRFYTASFFFEVREHLRDGGIFSFGVSGSQEMLGEIQIAFLGAIRGTLARVFPDVSVLPGDPVQFFAAGTGGRLTDAPETLVERMHQRGLTLSHVREDTLRDRFETFRRQYFDTVLEDASVNRVNRDFTPLCYAHALGLWSARWHSRLGDIVSAMTRIRLRTVWGGLVLICGLALLVFRMGKCRPRTAAVCLSVGTVGGVTMGVQMAILIVFQVMEGAVFLHLALIVTLFMAGLAMGAGGASALLKPGGATAARAGRLLIRIQTGLTLFPLLLAGIFFLLHSPIFSGGSPVMPAVFSVASLFSGILGGAHFAAASGTLAELGTPASGIGGRLYGIDLAGSAACLLAATFLVIPALGPLHLLPMLSAVAATGLIVLGSRPLAPSLLEPFDP
jgi:spermidine synthase